MAKYGIPYQGSKSGIADSIIAKLPSGKRFVDLFGGGFAMSHCALLSGKYESVLYNELGSLLPALIQKAIAGEYNYSKFKPEFITKDRFYELKDKDGYVKYIWSFSNNGKGYLFGENIEKQKESAHNFVVFGQKDKFILDNCPCVDKYVKSNKITERRLQWGRYCKFISKNRLRQLQQLEGLQRLERLELKCGSYLEYEYQIGDIVYCDPPYEATTGYNENSFNSKEFYDWCASRPYQVFFSSYKISDNRFEMVFAKPKRSLMGGTVGNLINYECLYVNKAEGNQ